MNEPSQDPRGMSSKLIVIGYKILWLLVRQHFGATEGVTQLGKGKAPSRGDLLTVFCLFVFFNFEISEHKSLSLLLVLPGCWEL